MFQPLRPFVACCWSLVQVARDAVIVRKRYRYIIPIAGVRGGCMDIAFLSRKGTQSHHRSSVRYIVDAKTGSSAECSRIFSNRDHVHVRCLKTADSCIAASEEPSSSFRVSRSALSLTVQVVRLWDVLSVCMITIVSIKLCSGLWFILSIFLSEYMCGLSKPS